MEKPQEPSTSSGGEGGEGGGGAEAAARKEEGERKQKPHKPKSRSELIAEIRKRNKRTRQVLEKMDQLGGPGNLEGLSDVQLQEMCDLDLELQQIVADIEEMEITANPNLRPLLPVSMTAEAGRGAGHEAGREAGREAGPGEGPLQQGMFAAAAKAALEMREKQETAEASRRGMEDPCQSKK